MGIFDYRRNYKPFEYPEVTDFTDAINKSFWVHSEVDFTADTQDFLSHLSEPEQNAVKNALLAIAQIEVNVKTFWVTYTVIYQSLNLMALEVPLLNANLDIQKLIQDY